MAAHIALEHFPLPLLRIELRAVPRQPNDMQPRGALLQSGPTHLAGGGGTIVDDQVDLLAARDVAALQRAQGQEKTRRVLPRTDDFHAAPPQGLNAAQYREPPGRARRGQRGLDAAPLPDPTDVRVRLHVGLVLVVHFVFVGLGGHLFFPPPPAPPHRRLRRRDLAGAPGRAWAARRRSPAAPAARAASPVRCAPPSSRPSRRSNGRTSTHQRAGPDPVVGSPPPAPAPAGTRHRPAAVGPPAAHRARRPHPPPPRARAT